MRFVLNHFFYYGEGEKADYRIGNLKKSQNGVLEAPGIEFTMSGALDADIRVNLPGDFNMYNAAAAVGTGTVGEGSLPSRSSRKFQLTCPL